MVRQARDDWPQRDYYAILDVPVTASRDEINRAYRRRARATHPDLNSDEPAAEQHFDELAAAREVLTDPAARAAYDELRARRHEPDRRVGDHASNSARPRRSSAIPSSTPVLGRTGGIRPAGATIRPGPVVWRPNGVRRP